MFKKLILVALSCALVVQASCADSDYKSCARAYFATIAKNYPKSGDMDAILERIMTTCPRVAKEAQAALDSDKLDFGNIAGLAEVQKVQLIKTLMPLAQQIEHQSTCSTLIEFSKQANRGNIFAHLSPDYVWLKDVAQAKIDAVKQKQGRLSFLKFNRVPVVPCERAFKVLTVGHGIKFNMSACNKNKGLEVYSSKSADSLVGILDKHAASKMDMVANNGSHFNNNTQVDDKYQEHMASNLEIIKQSLDGCSDTSWVQEFCSFKTSLK